MLAPVLMLLTAATGLTDPFEVTTPGKPGTAGLVPSLQATGSGTPGSADNLAVLDQALPGTSAILVFGLSELAAPFQGGILGPAPDGLVFGLPVDGAGSLSLPFTLTASLPVGLSVWTQFWIDDPGAVGGRSASNTLRVTVVDEPTDPPVLPGRRWGNAQQTQGMVLGDLDGDGRDELVLWNDFPAALQVRTSVGDGSYASLPSVPLPAQPAEVVLARIDDDPHLDALVALPDAFEVAVLLGDGDGTFTSAPALQSVTRADQLAAADVDGDGHDDIVVAGVLPTGLWLHSGLGDGSFGPPTGLSTLFAQDIALADLDGDARPELLTLGGGLGVFLNDGAGAFTLASTDPLPGDDLTVGDVTGDGHLDAVISHAASDALFVVPGLGDGTLAAAQEFAWDARPGAPWIGDLDGDGLADIAAASELGGAANILFGSGGGSFGALTREHVGPSVALAASDADGDGRLDLLAAHQQSGAVSVVLQEEAGAFHAAQRSELGGAFDCMAQGDLDGDGRPDLVVADTGTSGMRLLLADGQGDFTIVQAFFTNGCRDLELADVDLDGTLDVVMLRAASLQTWSGTGSGTLAPLATTNAPLNDTLHCADVDGDGQVDAVTTRLTQDTLAIQSGLGDGTFGGPRVLPTGDGPRDALTADLDGNGTLELIVSQEYDDSVGVYTEVGGATPVLGSFPAGDAPAGLAAGDVDGDSVIDVVTANASFPGAIHVLSGLGDGSLGAALAVSTGPGTGSPPRLADLDGDGSVDLVFALEGPDAVGLLLGDGSGAFAPVRTHAAGDAPRAVVIQDLDEDGADDVIALNAHSVYLSLLFQRP